MAVCFLTGGAWQLREQLRSDMRAHLADEAGENIIIVVPGQLTLEAERLALEAAGRAGSFRLQVFSVRRLCEKVLEQAGGSDAARIDENGRAMLMRRALDQLETPLRVYERARRSPGFAALASEAVSQWKEAGMDAEAIDALARAREGSPLGEKLADLACLFRAWHSCAQGLGIDDEDARRLAMSRLQDAPYFHGASVWFYGFDLLTRPVAECICALAVVCARVRVLVPLRESRRDEHLYRPIRKTYERMLALLRESGVPYEREEIDPAHPRKPNGVRLLERELFCYPVAAQQEPARELRLYSARNPRDEAEHIAASIRQMVRRHGLRYGDITLAVQGGEAMLPALRRAFALYEIPVFFPESRPASSHPLAASVLAALSVAAGPVHENDVQALLSLGYCGLSDDECDRMRNFAFSHGVKGHKWLRPYLPGIDPEGRNAAFEQLRQAAFAPVERLAEGLRTGSARERLEAIFRYLQETGAYERMLSQAEQIAAAGEPVRAAEGAQVWSKLTACMDQIAAIYANAQRPPSARVLADLFRQSLSVAELKPLPQSADAVAAGALEHMKTRPVRLMIIAGATDAELPGQVALLSDAERESIEKEIWLGPNRSERSCMQMLAAKSAVSFAQEMLWISWHVSGADGSVRRPGMLVRSVRALYPRQPISGGVIESERELALRLLQPDAALLAAGEALRREEGPNALETEALQALSRLPEGGERLRAMRSALQGDPLPGSIPPSLAGRLYDGPKSLSVSRLERFARCPFSHFLQYGARPEEIREYGVTPRDSGDFCHEALSRFTELYPGQSDPETAVQRMDSITAELLSEKLPGLAQDGAVYETETRQLREVARRAAVTNLKHMGASRFSPVAAETAFRGRSAVPLEGALLEGRIDRVDLWKAADETYLRIVD
ncbi:MAG: PD-(D/E)XK nuclease family protein, partial [Eubacteriales bacterium]|nr:PD-(D/E)XK nuclease family protein [Eubacteriales bacterium]